MKKFGFRTSSITFKALCVFLPIQVLILLTGYFSVNVLITQTKKERKEKFETNKNSLEKILKENPSLKHANFSSPKDISNPNTFPVFLSSKKTNSGPIIECIDEQDTGITDRFSWVKNKFQFRATIVDDLLIFFGKFEGYDIPQEHYIKIDFIDKISHPIKAKFIAKNSDDDEYKMPGTFVLEKNKEWTIKHSETFWKRNGLDGEYVSGSFSLALKRKNMIRSLEKIRLSLRENDHTLCKISPRNNISLYLTGSLQEKMNKIKQMKNGILFRDLNQNTIFKKDEYYQPIQNKLEKKSIFVRTGEILIGSQSTVLSPMCDDLKKILQNKNFSKLSICSSLFDNTVYIWSQERNWKKESLDTIYKIASVGYIFVVITTILLISLIWYYNYRLNKLQREIEEHVTSDGEILPTVEKMNSAQNDEVGILAKMLQLSFLKIRKRNTFYIKMSDFLRHELGQQFSKLRLKIANFNSDSNKDSIQKSLIKTLELSEKTVYDFTSTSDVISALNAGKREKIDLCSFMQRFIEYFETPDSKIRLEIKTEGIFVECIPDALERVISSILENATDFRKKDTEIICIIETKNSETNIIIKNQGRLIDEKDLTNIFDLGFSLRENDTQANEIHQGFGLFLVKAVIEFHGWNISAKNNSEPPGVEFIIGIL